MRLSEDLGKWVNGCQHHSLMAIVNYIQASFGINSAGTSSLQKPSECSTSPLKYSPEHRGTALFLQKPWVLVGDASL